jgi:hypothetical protein
VERFQRTWVCLTLSASPRANTSAGDFGALATSGMRAVFDPPCDRFTLVQAAGSYKAFAARSGASLVTVSSLGAASPSKVWLSEDGGFVFPVHTAIVAVVDGRVQAVAFDEGCAGCGVRSGYCGANTLVPAEGRVSCFVPRAACVDTPRPANPDANSCDLKVFVVWAGEDARGAFFTSSSSRLCECAREHGCTRARAHAP